MQNYIIPSGIGFKDYLDEYFKDYQTPVDYEIDGFDEFEETYLKHILSVSTGIPENKLYLTYTLEPLGYHGTFSTRYLRVYDVTCDLSEVDSPGYQTLQGIKYDLFPIIINKYD